MHYRSAMAHQSERVVELDVRQHRRDSGPALQPVPGGGFLKGRGLCPPCRLRASMKQAYNLFLRVALFAKPGASAAGPGRFSIATPARAGVV